MKKILKNKFEPKKYIVDESNFTLTNGYIGMRGAYEEGVRSDIKTIPGTYINGFYDLIDIKYAAKYTGYPDLYQRMIPIVDIQKINIFLDNEKIYFDETKISKYSISFDMSKGEISREYILKINNHESIGFNFKKIISFKKYEMFYQKIEISPNFTKEHNIQIDFPLEYNDILGDRGIPNDASTTFSKFQKIKNKRIDIKSQGIEYETSKSKLNYFFSTEVSGLESFENISKDHLSFIKKISNEKISIIKKNILFENKFNKNTFPTREIVEKIFSNYSYDQLKDDNKNVLDAFWSKAETKIISDDKNIELYNNFNLYQVFANSGKMPWTSIAAKGLSGEGYGGHYFWDTEIYLINPLTLLEPALAKQLLLFRYNTLGEAKKIAKVIGHNGAMFPWRTIDGNETSTYYPAGTAQYHINGDISYAFVNYFKATLDFNFLFNYGFEILIETSRMWVDKIEITNDVAHINSVTGPDEYQIIVNDDFYTNCVAKYNLEWTYKAYEIFLKKEPELCHKKMNDLKVSLNEITNFLSLSKKIVIPYDETLKINPQHDNFLKRKRVELKSFDNMRPLLRTMHPIAINNLQICKQADVVLAYLLWKDIANEGVMKRSLKYYEQIDTADSSLSKCIYSIMKARLAIDDFGFNEFIENIYLDLDDTHNNTYRGLHMAGMGGSRMFMLYGLLGLTINDDSVGIDPKINHMIQGFEIKIFYRENLIKFTVDSQFIKVENLTKKSKIKIIFKNNEFILNDEVKIHV